MVLHLVNMSQYRNVRAAIIEIIFDNSLPCPSLTRERIFDHIKTKICEKYSEEQLRAAESYLSGLTENEFIEFCIGEQKQHQDKEAKETQAFLIFVAENLLPPGHTVMLPEKPEDQPNPGG